MDSLRKLPTPSISLFLLIVSLRQFPVGIEQRHDEGDYVAVLLGHLAVVAVGLGAELPRAERRYRTASLLLHER